MEFLAKAMEQAATHRAALVLIQKKYGIEFCFVCATPWKDEICVKCQSHKCGSCAKCATDWCVKCEGREPAVCEFCREKFCQSADECVIYKLACCGDLVCRDCKTHKILTKSGPLKHVSCQTK